MSNKNMRSRKWMLTFQKSHIEDGWTHERIKEVLSSLKLQYYAMVDEIGEKTNNQHTHVIMYRPSAIRVKTLEKLFPTIHQDALKGSVLQGREYLLKTQISENSNNSFEEWGELPKESGQGHRSDLEEVYQMIKEGLSNCEILEKNPNMLLHLSKIDKARLDIFLNEKGKKRRLDLKVTYIYGKTGCGKTKGVLDLHGDENVYRITNYLHPFDSYQCEDVVMFEEYRSNFLIGDLLNYLDVYPISLNARYYNRVCAWNFVYIISNWKLEEQYTNIQELYPETWSALLRRIHTIRIYTGFNKFIDFTPAQYFDAMKKGTLSHWETINPKETPFSTDEQKTAYIQENLKLK